MAILVPLGAWPLRYVELSLMQGLIMADGRLTHGRRNGAGIGARDHVPLWYRTGCTMNAPRSVRFARVVGWGSRTAAEDD